MIIQRQRHLFDSSCAFGLGSWTNRAPKGERLRREQIHAVVMLRAGRRQAEAEGLVSTRAIPSDTHYVADQTRSFAPAGFHGLPSRVLGIQDEQEAANMQRLKAVGRRASVEFQAQFLVLQRT
ncbi:MAG: hypothetical protein F4X97_12980 [Boseongicola sp. SB0662_bin_57]|nr:hypothetical protein [Boseongicola sp. SB0662_bin_57]